MTTNHIEIPEADYLAMREEVEQLRAGCKVMAMAEADAMALVIAHEGRIETLQSTIAKLREAVRLCDAYFSFSKMLSGGYAESSINRLGIANEMKWKAEQAIAEVEQ